MAREISTTLAVDGEQAYKRAIQEASKSISQMGAQLTLATAQFKKDGDAMKLMSSRSKVLKEEIKQQQEIVKSLEGAVKEVTDRYGENSKEAEKWEAQLARAQAKLLNLEHELDNNDKGLDKNGKAFAKDTQQAQNFGQQLSALDKIQQSTTFQALNTALGNVENGFKSALNMGKQFGAFVWDKAVESSNRYDELATDATKIGVAVQELRAWQLAAELIDTSVGDITKGMTKLVNPTDKVSQALRELGVHSETFWAKMDENGEMQRGVIKKSTLDMFWEAVESLNAMKDATKQEELANTLFGKSFRELLPLIQAGREEWDKNVNKALETAPDEGAAKKLTTFNDALAEYKHVLGDFQDTFMAGIAPGLTDLTGAGTEFLTALTKWGQSPEGQEKLAQLSGAITELVSSLGTESNFSAAVEAATGVIKGFTGALQWILDNHEAVGIGVGAIATGLAAIKVGGGVLSVLTLINQIKWLDVAKGAKALADAAGGGAGANTSTSAAAGAAETGAVATLTTGSKLLDALGIGALAKTAYELSQELGTGILGYGGRKNQLQTLDVVWPEGTQQPIGDLKRPRNITGTASADSMLGYKIERTAEKIYDDLYKAINDYDPDTNALDTTQFFDNALYPLIQEATGIGGVTGDAADSIADLIYDKWIQSLFDEDWEGTTDGILNILQEAIEDAQSAAGPDAEAAGKAVSDGMAAGITAGIPVAVAAAGRLAAAVNAKLRSVLQIASPSKVTRGLGQFVGEGFALGIDDAQGQVLAAVNRMASIGTPRRAAAAFAGSTYDGRTYHSSRSLYIDKYNQYAGTDVHELMDAMDAETRYENQGMGA